MWGEAKRPVSGSIRPLSAQAAAGLPFPGPAGRVFGSSLKNGVFLNVPLRRKAANAAKLLTYAALAAWVRQTSR